MAQLLIIHNKKSLLFPLYPGYCSSGKYHYLLFLQERAEAMERLKIYSRSLDCSNSQDPSTFRPCLLKRLNKFCRDHQGDSHTQALQIPRPCKWMVPQFLAYLFFESFLGFVTKCFCCDRANDVPLPQAVNLVLPEQEG